MQSKSLFPKAARQVCLSCLIMMLYVISILLNDTPLLGFPVLYIIYSVVILFINRIFSGRPRTISQIVLLNVICGCVFYTAFVLTGAFPLVWRAVFGFFAVLIITITGASCVFGTLKLNSILLATDANILLLIFSVLLLGSLPHPYTWVLFAVIGAASGLLGSASCRMGRALSLREWGVWILLLLLIAVVAWLLSAFVVSPLSTGMYGLGKGLLAGLGFLWEQLNRFVSFLASLWPDEEGAAAALPAPAASSGTEEEMEAMQGLGSFPIIIAIVIAAAVVVILVLIVRKTGRNKVAKQRTLYTTDAEYVQRTSLRQAWKKAVLRMKRRLRAKRYLVICKDRPEGIYYKLRKVCRHTAFEHQPGDTAAEFLGRIREAFIKEQAEKTEDRSVQNMQAGQQLAELIRQLNINFYSQRPAEVSYSWAGSLIASVKKMGRKNRIKKAAKGKNAV